MKPTQSPDPATPANQVQQVLQRRQPDRIVYAPNYWQWFAHHRNHGLLPPEIAHCRTQRDEVMRLTSNRFLITGGISAIETERFQSADEVRHYVADLFERLRPYSHRFMFAASCNTSIRTPWRVLKWFRDAWQQFNATN